MARRLPFSVGLLSAHQTPAAAPNFGHTTQHHPAGRMHEPGGTEGPTRCALSRSASDLPTSSSTMDLAWHAPECRHRTAENWAIFEDWTMPEPLPDSSAELAESVCRGSGLDGGSGSAWVDSFRPRRSLPRGEAHHLGGRNENGLNPETDHAGCRRGGFDGSNPAPLPGYCPV